MLKVSSKDQLIEYLDNPFLIKVENPEEKPQINNLIECFTTFQGEGPNMGQNMLLLRFKECNRMYNGCTCEYCDTAVKMRISQPFSLQIDVIQSQIDKHQCGLLITGGEPTFGSNLQDIVNLITYLDFRPYILQKKYINIKIESNGYKLYELRKKLRTIVQKCFINYIFSPKIFNDDDFTENIRILKLLTTVHNENDLYIKVVYTGNKLHDTFIEYILTTNLRNNIYLMPEGRTTNEVIKNTPIVLDAAEKYNTCFSSRLHLLHNFI